MRRRISLTTLVLPALLAPLALVGPASKAGATGGPGAYVFHRVADTSSSSPITGFFAAPSLNNAGQVAFTAVQRAGGGGIFRGDREGVESIADNGATSPFDGFGYSPGINDVGTVAFYASRKAGGGGIFVGAGGPTTALIETGTLTGFANPVINNSGAVAFWGLTAGGQGLFTLRDGVLTPVAITGGIYSNFNEAPSLNDLDQVVFTATLSDGTWGVFRTTGASIDTIANSNRGFYPPFDLTSFGTPAINNSGRVVFPAWLDYDHSRVLTGPDPSPNHLTVVAEDFEIFDLAHSSINDQGQTAIDGVWDPALSVSGTILAGTSREASRVIGVGDVLDNSTVLATLLGNRAINNHGQIAFLATLSDGRTGIYVATPNLPVAAAGPDQTVAVPHDGTPATATAAFTLDGSLSSVPDSRPLSYAWRENATLLGSTPQLQLARPVGTYSFALTVTDPDGGGSTDTIGVQVLPEPNRAPVARAGADVTVTMQGLLTAVTLNGNASSDPDSDGLTYQWKEVSTVLGAGAVLTTSLAVGSHTLTLTVADSYGVSHSDEVKVQIALPASTPGALVAGLGQITVPGGKATFALLDISRANGQLRGGLLFQDPMERRLLTSTRLTALTVTGKKALIFGRAQLQGRPDVDFVVEAQDLGNLLQGKDRFRIERSDGYTREGLVQGDIVVRVR